MEPNTKNFPKRNRIISGIANSILVVEAEHRSGSTITANYAKKQSKKVYAIPSNIDSVQGVGTNRLIREGAILVTKPSDIKKDIYLLETKSEKLKDAINNLNSKIKINPKNMQLQPKISSLKNKSNDIGNNEVSKTLDTQTKYKSKSNSITKKIPKEYKSIYKILENGPMHINEIAKLEQKSISELNGIMTMMEIEGYITRLASNQYKRKD